MGADGHIAFYEVLKTNRIAEEINRKYSLKKDERVNLHTIAYKCDFRVNGHQYCYLVYWELGRGDVDFGWQLFREQYKRLLPKSKWVAIKEFEDRIKEEATIVKDQEVWT